MARTAQVFGILFAGFVLVCVALAGAGWWWWKTHSAELIETAKTVIEQGKAEGAKLDEGGCLELAMERHRGAGEQSLTTVMTDSMWLTSCLHASKRQADFCTNVPGSSHPIDYSKWANEQCAARGFKDAYCGALMQTVSAYCESPQRAQKP